MSKNKQISSKFFDWEENSSNILPIEKSIAFCAKSILSTAPLVYGELIHTSSYLLKYVGCLSTPIL